MSDSGAEYAVSVEFYDLLQADRDRRLALRRYAEAAGRARRGILDVGAGTGIVTEVLLRSGAAPVHAVEPAPAMRAALMARAAGLGADQRARLTVHPGTVGETGLDGEVDLAVASNVIGCLDPDDRRAAWDAVARALLPDGLLLFDPPPAALPSGPEAVEALGPVRVGPDAYSARATREPHQDTIRTTFTYRVEREGELLREEQESFTMWATDPHTLGRELRAYGLQVVPAPHSDLLAARRSVR
ncbi:class I SAM-dependent methyltransferase [Streptomyces sp. TLI_171]|uniref:class I SAM-dependent methyltransferase n=1 Tax=Streptomyces sp. TLI_171 TaxID=1938859 RepID=UPI000C542661|nr:class I SAM-dependent methyltransferase [Streptomyces sp. TLI_171]RKE16826.1 methyltransferase family protein [Streptomyces sp. TLI_171]